jgi:flagellar protein FliJ
LPKFRFSLETLLRHREDIEQREKEELLRRTYKYQLEVGHRNDLNARYQETTKEIARKSASNPNDPELNWFYLYLNRLAQEMKECEVRLAKLQSEVQSQKEAVIEASKKRKTLASLKTKREKEFIFEMEKQEQKEIDDLVVTRYTIPESASQTSADNLKALAAEKTGMTKEGDWEKRHAN